MKQWRAILLGQTALLLASCTNPLPDILPRVASQGPTDTPAQAASPAPSETLLATPTLPPSTLTVCAGSEPADLYLYNELSEIKKTVLSAIYDGPVDRQDFGYQPVILLKLPSLADGDAVVEAVPVQAGDPVVDDAGIRTVLGAGVRVRPAGCRSSTCAVTSAGDPLTMDLLRVTFHLRPGVEWADGAALTAADSVFSYRVATDAATLYGNNGLISGSAQSVTFTASYTALDDLTVEWTGLPGFLDPDYQADFFIPLPEHQLGAYDVSQLAQANEVLYAPLGWGPYYLVSWQQSQEMVLQPNPHYFRRAEGLPHFDQLVFRFAVQNGLLSLASLADGSCDVLLADASPEVPGQVPPDLVNRGAAQEALDLQPVFEQLTFSIAPADPAVLPLFADLRMRSAVAACIDRGALVSAIYGDLVSPLEQALPSDHPLMAGADLPAHPFDLANAAALLAAVGWADTNGDGILEAHAVPGIPDDTPLRFAITTSDTFLRTRVSGLIAAQLRSCGMDVTVQQAPARDLLAQNAEAPLSGRRFQLAEVSSTMSVEAVCALSVTDEISSEANGWTGSNLGGYSDPALDVACAEVAASLPGSADYVLTHQTALRILSEQLLVLPLFPYARLAFTRPDLSGFTSRFDPWSQLQNVEDFQLEP